MKDETALVKIEPPDLTDIGSGVEFTETGLVLPEGLPIESWLKLGVTLRRWHRGVSWWLVDHMAYGDRTYGSKVSQGQFVADQLGLDISATFADD